MNFWEILSLIGLGATVLGAWLTASSYYNGERTRALLRDLAALSDQRHGGTQDMIREMSSGTQAATSDLPKDARRGATLCIRGHT